MKKPKKKEIQEFLVKKLVEKWYEENPTLAKDIENLAAQFAFFNMKYGTRLNPQDVIREFNK